MGTDSNHAYMHRCHLQKKVCKNSIININNKITFQDKVDQRIHKKSCIECIYSDILGKEKM